MCHICPIMFLNFNSDLSNKDVMKNFVGQVVVYNGVNGANEIKNTTNSNTAIFAICV